MAYYYLFLRPLLFQFLIYAFQFFFSFTTKVVVEFDDQ